jgi:hypothetical protein
MLVNNDGAPLQLLNRGGEPIDELMGNGRPSDLDGLRVVGLAAAHTGRGPI